MILAVILFWASLIFLFWIYIGYPGLLYLINPHRKIKADFQGTSWPSVSLVIPTFNEIKVIQKKLENVRTLNYPKDKLEVILVDGGSTDGTSDTAKQIDANLIVIQLGAKLGKAKAVNKAIECSRKEIVVITDANAYMDPEALRLVAQTFSDPHVGAATGAMRQIPYQTDAISEGGGLYWQYEVYMRKRESALHSVISMSGELSAIRRKIFVDDQNNIMPWYVPGGTDDFEMSLWVIHHGYRVVYAADARVWEYAPDSVRDLFKQKVRIIVQTIISVRRNFKMVFTSGIYGWLIFLSRKILPLLSPWCIIILTLTSALLIIAEKVYVIPAQVVLIGLGAWTIGSLLPQRINFARTFRFLLLLNATVFIAWIHYWQGRDYTHWQTVASTRR